MARLNLYDIITNKNFDAQEEFNRIHSLFHDDNYVKRNGDSLHTFIEMCFYKFPVRFKGRALSLTDFNNTYGFDFEDPTIEVTNDKLIIVLYAICILSYVPCREI